ncbi:hypothetical protein Pla175_39990 [Pirellulimonas nuda]|uniref:Uncharacterized protein n=1 Tax=Pirellulimonas nuda TaxID=2528009 RepID=A0A518DGM8_9BACT|nr:hypothetical protein [Pirellulimonas nuda]QDU90592.1 hypothetical protein Pla175_39990 [Pirellulimonas nuda]
MKLRIKDNSLRVRLDRKDLAELLAGGQIESRLAFGPTPAQQFTYAVELTQDTAGAPRADYRDGRIVVSIGDAAARAWSDGDQVGFEVQQPTEAGTVRLLVEKDFSCIERPADQAEDDAWAFPNPATHHSQAQ